MKITIDAWYPEEIEIAARAMTEILEFRRNVGNLSGTGVGTPVGDPDGPETLSDVDRREAERIERDALDGKMEPVAEQPQEDVKSLVVKVHAKHGVEKVKEILREMGFARIGDVPADRTAELIGKFNESLA